MDKLNKKTPLPLMLKRASSHFLDLLFPVQCIGCGIEGTWLCQECFSKIKPAIAARCPFCETRSRFGKTCGQCSKARFLDGAISCAPYANAHLQTIIHEWKYNGVRDLTRFLSVFIMRSLQKAKTEALKITKTVPERGLSGTTLIKIAGIPPILTGEHVFLQPIPLHNKREKDRGFNQARLLTEDLSKMNKKWHEIDSLFRLKKTHAQAMLSGIDRHTNIQGAFGAKETPRLCGRHVVLIDDVITTGNTADECAGILKRKGAASVWILTAAYGHPAT